MGISKNRDYDYPVELTAGQYHSPGARVHPGGTSFSLYSSAAVEVELLLFESPDSAHPAHSLKMDRREGSLHRIFAPGVGPGTLYAYRVLHSHGEATDYPSDLLLDPRARALVSGRAGLLGMVVVDQFDWRDDAPPDTPWHDTIIYEAHIKSMTARHPEIPLAQRGTFAGFAHDGVIQHFKRLGVTAVEIMPVHACRDEPNLLRRNLTNFWGYNTVSFFALDARFAVADAGPVETMTEFKEMVRKYHCAGLEIILDVVYNHTAEGDAHGPVLNFKGIDNDVYYRMDSSGDYVNWSGCGNTYNTDHPEALSLLLESLRYWVREMHVDGFRFDLAGAISRDDHGFNPRSNFIQAIKKDPLLSRVKLIAEPWSADLSTHEHCRFPPPWRQWNSKYRDTMRRFWRGEPALLGDFATRLAGSSDMFETGIADEPGESWTNHRSGPDASINYITSHDGFTMTDLVSYASKHNEANGEDNQDGADREYSSNHGAEGATSDEKINAARARRKRNLMASLLLSQGVPMILGGDELGFTRRGNNNAYCQDNELNYLDWNREALDPDFLFFVRRLIRYRTLLPVLRFRRFLRGADAGTPDVSWLRPDGSDMSIADWENPENRRLCVLLSRAGDSARKIMILINGNHDDRTFTLPEPDVGYRWRSILDTAHRNGRPTHMPLENPPITADSIRVLRLVRRRDG